MKKKLSDDYECMLINIGSCELHIVHNSFKTGATATEWKVVALLSSLYYLFKDSPARRVFWTTVFGSEKFSNLNLSTDRLVELFNTHMNTEPYQRLFKVVPLLLVLSCGQASVERGFSVNKEHEVENLSNQSCVAQCLVCDHVKAVDGVLNVPITQALLTSCASARKRYERYLDEQRQNKKSEQESRKRKSLLDKVEELKEKKRRLSEDIDSLVKTADNLAEKAESTGSISFVTQSNSLRRTSKEKTSELKNVEKEMEQTLETLKTC